MGLTTSAVARVLGLVEVGLVDSAVSDPQRAEFARLARGMRAAFDADDDRNLMCVHVPRLMALGLGSSTDDAESVAAICTTVYGAARLVDDLMDGQPVSYVASGRETVLALATTLCASGYRVIIGSPVSDVQKVALVTEVSGMILAMGDGQLADVRGFAVERSAGEVLASVSGKSGAMLAGFARCGAIAAGAGAAILQACREFGNSMGVARQILADLAELRHADSSDAVNTATTLPIALHLTRLDVGDHARFFDSYRLSAGCAMTRAALLEELAQSGALAAARLYAEVALSDACDALDRVGLAPAERAQLDKLIDLR